MAKSRETYSKKENQKKKLKKRQDKAERKEERKESSVKGQSLEEMTAYVDEFGNLSSQPPDPMAKKREVDQAKMYVDHPERRALDEVAVRKGIVSFFNESKGFGFIRDQRTQESIYVHANGLTEPIREKDKVTFETQRTTRGLSAINVAVIK